MKPSAPSPDLHDAAATVHEGCVACDLCVNDCGFLQRHGNPGSIAADLYTGKLSTEQGFGCSLCGLCDAVCPKDLRFSDLMRRSREAAVATDRRHLAPYAALRRYETLGQSWPFRHHALPAGCDTVLFPGCALPGTRPAPAWELYRHLQKTIPRLGLVLDCCAKPSHDLGDQVRFQKRFGALREGLVASGIRRVLVACPNCLQVFREHGAPLESETVWEVLVQAGPLQESAQDRVFTVHDPCVTRYESGVQDAARTLARASGLEIEEMPHHKANTVCCGEGGAVGYHAPEHAQKWAELRGRQTADRPVLTYCAGCTEQLGARVPTLHLLDLLFGPPEAVRSPARPVGSLKRYWNRWRLARRAHREIGPDQGR